MKQDKKMDMMIGALKALDYLKKNPNAEIEKTIRFVMDNIEGKCQDKVSAIAGASKAIQIKEKSPRMTDKVIAQTIMEDAESIIGEGKEF